MRVETTQEELARPIHNREALVGRLRQLGLRFLAPTDAEDLSQAPIKELIAQLAILCVTAQGMIILQPDMQHILAAWILETIPPTAVTLSVAPAIFSSRESIRSTTGRVLAWGLP